MPQHVNVLPQWKLHIYQVRTQKRQQRILSAFARIGRPGVVATAAESGPEWFVIVEFSTRSTEIHAMRVVRILDPGAVRTYEGVAQAVA